MISICLPTRRRVPELTRMVASLRATTSSRDSFEVVVYVGDDDPESLEVATSLGCKVVVGPRKPLGELWNECASASRGELLMQANDDVIFRTSGWNEMVEREFESYPDKILMVFGDDLGCHRGRFGPHPIISRRWYETVGYLVPGCFAGDYTDTWVNDVARALGRDRFLPFLVEHMHHVFEKREIDDTARERIKAEAQQNWNAVYNAMAPERAADVAKLRAAIAEPYRRVRDLELSR